MRKCTLVLVFSVFTATAFCQQTTPSLPERDYDYFIKKSGRQKSAGWILTVAGSAGLVYPLSKDIGRSLAFLFSSHNYKSYAPYYVASGVAVAAGIFSFSAANRNKKEAAALQTSFKMGTAPVLNNNGIGSKAYPSVALTVGL